MKKDKVLTIRIKKEIKENLTAISEKNDRAVSDYLTSLIKYAIRENLKYSDLL